MDISIFKSQVTFEFFQYMQHGVNGQVAVRHVIRAEKRQDQEHAINIAKMLRTAILYKQQAAMGMIVQVRNHRLFIVKMIDLSKYTVDCHKSLVETSQSTVHFHPKRPSDSMGRSHNSCAKYRPVLPFGVLTFATCQLSLS